MQYKHKFAGRTIYEWRDDDNQPVEERRFRCVNCFPSRTVVCIHVKKLKQHLMSHKSAVAASKITSSNTPVSGMTQEQRNWINRLQTGHSNVPISDADAVKWEKKYQEQLKEMRRLQKQMEEAVDHALFLKRRQEIEQQQIDDMKEVVTESEVEVIKVHVKRFVDLNQEEL